MNQTRKIVVEHYPVDKLPEELRRGLEGVHDVTVTIEEAPGIVTGAPREKRTLRSLVGAAPGLYDSPEDAVAYIRSLRDESDR